MSWCSACAPANTAFPSRSPTIRCSILVLAVPEAHPNAEERRLLYVAITRARHQVFLLARRRSAVFVRQGTDRRRIRYYRFWPAARSRRPLSAMQGGTPGTSGKCARPRHLLRLSRTGPIASTRGVRVQVAEPDCRSGPVVPTVAATAMRYWRAAASATVGWKPGWAIRPFPGCSNWPDCDYTRNL